MLYSVRLVTPAQRVGAKGVYRSDIFDALGAHMGRRILVADDSSTIQKVIKIAFSRLNTEILEASSYLEAINSLMAKPGVAGPDLLIVDASLPGVRSPTDFRRLADECGGAPVLLLVGSYEAVNEEAFRSAGFQHFLKKPFESGDIVAFAERLLGAKLSSAPPLSATTIPPPSPSVPFSAMPSSTGYIPPPPVLPVLPVLDLPKATLDSRIGDGPITPPPPGRAFRDTMIGAPALITTPGLPGFSEDQPDDSDDDALPNPWDVSPPPPPVTDEARRGRKAFTPPATTPFVHRGSEIAMPGVARSGSVAEPPPLPSSASRQSSASLSEQLLPLLEEMLPALVRQAVEDYCNRHFKPLAREVIATELRRLADDKARHLVDN